MGTIKLWDNANADKRTKPTMVVKCKTSDIMTMQRKLSLNLSKPNGSCSWLTKRYLPD